MRWTSTAVIVAALLAYGVSLLFLPIFECRSDEPFFRLARDNDAASGFVLLLTGWAGALEGEFRWFANPIFLLMIVHLRKGATKSMAYIWPVLAGLAAVTSVFIPAQACGGAVASAPSKSLAIGGYLWVIAVMSVSLLYIARLRMASAKAP